ncbi:MAG: hypothetical protein KatS3mg035_0518 [Bacteroidia bacterium]|nr:MAG: hypothetical protein KatS3mg035_0518 [Bacteroidia bacterium]
MVSKDFGILNVKLVCKFIINLLLKQKDCSFEQPRYNSKVYYLEPVYLKELKKLFTSFFLGAAPTTAN